MIVARLEGWRIPSRGTVPEPTGRSSETLSSKTLQSTGWRRSKGKCKGVGRFMVASFAPRVHVSLNHPMLPERVCFNWYIKVAQALSAELCYLRRATHPSGENEKTKRKATINMLLPFSSLIPPPSTNLVRSWRFKVPASRSEG